MKSAIGWAYCITSSIDMVTVSWRLWLTPLVWRLLEAVTGGGITPTSRGSNLLGDSPSVLPLTEAESDISVLEWNDEMEELVSSVMEERTGGEGPLVWKVSELPFTTMVVWGANTPFPASSDL